MTKIKTSVTQKIDNYIYNLPFESGKTFKIIQGYGGIFTHYNTAALDFAMPIGTPIYAAREGTIYSYKDDSNEHGPLKSYKNKANYIIIKHPDGSYGCYWHLKYNGVITKKGIVQKGEVIGYSGNTGYTFYPHLHFSVKSILDYKKESYLQTKFQTTNGNQILKQGENYTNPN